MDIPHIYYSNSALFRNQLYAYYAHHGMVVITGFPIVENHNDILWTMSQFGPPEKEHYGGDHDYYHVLKAQDEPLKDRIGHVITSSTNREFEMHTDNYRQVKNAAVIGLLCIQPAAQGGDNFITPVDKLLKGLLPNTLEGMKTAAWPHPTGPIPLLRRMEDGYLIRYNRDTIEGLADALQQPLAPWQVEAMDHIDAAADTAKVRLRLEKGEMLVLDNERFLHGRSAFEPNSQREVIRWRISAQ